MSRVSAFAALAGTALLLGACANSADVIGQREDMLAAAGFSLRPADTPDRIASLKGLPPHKFVSSVRSGVVTYVYADPTICGCLYVGDQAAYGRYQKMVFDKKIADEQQAAAQLNDNAALNWNVGPWGAWPPYW
jgi:hypothetical protein